MLGVCCFIINFLQIIMKSIFKNYQYDMSFRSLNDISYEELKDICLLSGEVSNDFLIEKIERHCDEDENCRYVTIDCKSVYQDNSYSSVQICINDIFVVWFVDLKRKNCDNICRRDVICKQYEVMIYLILKGFSFNNEFHSVNQFISNREKWLSK